MDKQTDIGLHSLVEQAVFQNEDRFAVIYDTGELKQYLTYKQLWATSSLVMDAVSRYAVKGEVIGMCLDQDKCIPAFVLGVLRSGAAFYNFEAESRDFVSQVIQETHVRILILDIKHLSMLQDMIMKFDGKVTPFIIPDCPHVVFVELQLVLRRKCHHKLAYCITTSGTTGKPKIVQVPHCCIVPNIIHIRDIYHLTSDDLVLLCSPLTFDPCIVELFTSLSVGASVLIVPTSVKVSPEKLLDMVFFRNKVSVIQCTPALLRRFDSSRMRETILGNTSALRVLSLGGEKFPSCTEIQRLRTSGNQTKFFNLYGITEVSCWAMCHEVMDLSMDSGIHLGYPLLDTEVKVCDVNGEKIITEGIGRIFLGGTSRQCIIGSDEEECYNMTVTRWRDTGDYGKVTKDGLIYYIGREDTQIKRQGKRLNLEEINQVVKEISSIRCCITQLIDGALVLFIVLDSSIKDLSALTESAFITDEEADSQVLLKSFVTQKIRSNLPGHYVPDHVLQVENLPITKHGKVDQKELISMYRKQLLPEKLDPLDCLKTSWKAILCISCDDISDDSLFIQNGGNSLKAVQLIDKLELEMGCKLPKLLDLILGKPFKTISDYIETIVLERSEMIRMGKQVRTTAKQNTAVYGNKPVVEFMDRIENSLDTHAFIDQNKETDLNDLGQDSLQHDTSVLIDSLKETKTENEKPAFSDCFKEYNMHNFNTVVLQDNFYIKKEDTRLSVRAETVDKLSIDKQWTAISKKRILDDNFPFENENKKVKYNENKSKFYKCIQRGNKIYELSCSDAVDNKETLTVPVRSLDVAAEYNGMNSYNKRMKDGNFDGQIKITLKERWKYNTGKCVDASPLLAISKEKDGDVVYIGSHSHKFCAISMSTGDCVWETTLGDRIESSAALSACGNYIIVGCYDGYVYVLDSHTGDVFWQYQTGSGVKSSPAVDMATSLVYIGSHSQSVYAFNIKERICAWKVHLNRGSIFCSPAVAYNPHCVLVGTLGGWLISLSVDYGQEVWRYCIGKPIFSSPSISSHGVIVGCVDKYLYHIDHSGTLLWRFESQGPIFSSPAIWNSFQEPAHSNIGLNSVPSSTDSVGAETETSAGFDQYSLKQLQMKAINILEQCKRTSSIHDSFDQNCHENIIVGSHEGAAYCVTNMGKPVWKIDTESAVYSTPFSNTINVNGHSNDTFTIDNAYDLKSTERVISKTGMVYDKKYQGKTSGNLTENIKRGHCVADDYTPDGTDSNTTDGRIDTVADTDNAEVFSLPVVIIASTTGTLYIVGAEDGQIFYKFQMKGEVFSSPILYRNSLVIGCRDDNVYCFDIETVHE